MFKKVLEEKKINLLTKEVKFLQNVFVLNFDYKFQYYEREMKDII